MTVNDSLTMKVNRANERKKQEADYADDLALLTCTSAQAESLLHNLKQEAGDSGLYMNSVETEFI